MIEWLNTTYRIIQKLEYGKKKEEKPWYLQEGEGHTIFIKLSLHSRSVVAGYFSRKAHERSLPWLALWDLYQDENYGEDCVGLILIIIINDHLQFTMMFTIEIIDNRGMPHEQTQSNAYDDALVQIVAFLFDTVLQ